MPPVQHAGHNVRTVSKTRANCVAASLG